MKMSNIGLTGFLAFLIVFSGITLAAANGWGDPLATDTLGDGTMKGQDILTVDARLANGFVDFRFILNDSFYSSNLYGVYIDLDKNISTGDVMDLGSDLYIECEIVAFDDVRIYFQPYGGSDSWVYFNMTANNGTATAWSDPSVVPYFHFLTVTNTSQAEVAYGVNWTWLLQELAPIAWDGSSVYLIFFGGAATDYCPNQGLGADDYLEWIIFDAGGIPIFEFLFVVFTIFSISAFYALKKKFSRF
jgi:hypothetical protein